MNASLINISCFLYKNTLAAAEGHRFVMLKVIPDHALDAACANIILLLVCGDICEQWRARLWLVMDNHRFLLSLTFKTCILSCCSHENL